MPTSDCASRSDFESCISTIDVLLRALAAAARHRDFVALIDEITNEWASVITLLSILMMSGAPVPTTAYHHPRQLARHHHAHCPTHHNQAAHQPRIQ
jgi:hypothetical protein